MPRDEHSAAQWGFAQGFVAGAKEAREAIAGEVAIYLLDEGEDLSVVGPLARFIRLGRRDVAHGN